MKICSIRIKGFQQFDDIYLDFTNPKTGKPVEKVCFIGRNGTGKSTLLKIINKVFERVNESLLEPFFENQTHIATGSLMAIEFSFNDKRVYQFFPNMYCDDSRVFLYRSSIKKNEDWFEKFYVEYKNKRLYGNTLFTEDRIEGDELEVTVDEIWQGYRTSNIYIYSPSESKRNSYMQVSDVPKTNLGEALSFSRFHVVSDENVQYFWRVLMYLISKRSKDRELFENKEENLNKTKRHLIEEFDKDNPKILDKLGDLWNKILDKSGLYFDVENASLPVALSDNLHAYIKLKKTNETINYNQLSTGIRNFIFRVGHIYSLYFNREIKNGFLLLDEPENSLFPDFLFELIETYQEIVIDKNGENNTQFFVSTHNPIIAAQFEPYERIILEWNENGFVTAEKGKTPVGDDPNDILLQDFRLPHLMGKKGLEKWKEFQELSKKLRKITNKEEKEKLVSEITKIGSSYNF